MSQSNKHLGERLIKTICVEYCTDEFRYLCDDSHFVQIPEDLYSKVLNTITDGTPMYFKIVNSKDHSKSIVLGKIEPSIKTPNSDKTTCLLPLWILQKLNIDSFNGYVDLFNINYNDVPRPGFIKLKANISSYTEWSNVKERIEERLGYFNCINIGDNIKIDDVKFTITELKDKNKNDIKFASTFDETDVVLDFDIPDDLVEKEKRRKIEEENTKKSLAIQRMNNLSNSINQNKSNISSDEVQKLNKTQKFHVGGGANVKTFSELNNDEERKNVDVFATKGYKLTSKSTNYKPSREELAKITLDRIEKMKNESK